MRVLGPDLVFPSPELASEEGLVAIGGDLTPERLLLAYAQGIFPWPSAGMPLLWFSPDPRCVLELSEVHVPTSLAKAIRRGPYEVRFDTAFREVIHACAVTERPGERGTWITPNMERAYLRLHQLGFAHSIEAWRGHELVGGLYGVSLGTAFFGESMFARAPDASKVAFVTLLGHLVEWGFTLVDCQMKTAHLARFGAREIPRPAFLERVREAVAAPREAGPWRTTLSPAEALATLRAGAGAP